MAATDHAVVVGIAKYPNLEPLSGPENDAKDFAAWLEDPSGGAVPHRNIDCILSSDTLPQGGVSSAHPTMDRLDSAFERLINRSRKNGGHGGRRLYVYLAGHGCEPKQNEVGLLSASASQLRVGDYLAGRQYGDWFTQAAYFDEVVWFMDCCRENYPRIPPRPPPWAPVTSTRQSNHFYGYATQPGQPSREGPDPDSGEVRGLFTLALLAGLRDADRDQQGRLTSTALSSFVYSKMAEISQRVLGDRVQDPQFEIFTNHEVVFEFPAKAPARPTWTVTVKLSRKNRGKPVELLGGDGEVIPPGSSGTVNWQWDTLPDGLYRLRLDSVGDKFFELLGHGGAHHEDL